MKKQVHFLFHKLKPLNQNNELIFKKKSQKNVLIILKKLQNEGFIFTYQAINLNAKNSIKIFNKYTYKNQKAIQHFIFFQNLRPNFITFKALVLLLETFSSVGTLLLNTNIGVISHKEALKNKIGGYLLCWLF